MYSVHDWAEVHQLYRQGSSKSAIARQLGMSRNTVARLLQLSEPPCYERAQAGSVLDPYKDAILAMLRQDPTVRCPVILQQLRRLGYAGGRTILKDYLQQVRPQFLAAQSYQRTTYLPGEIGQADWWHTGLQVPVGKGKSREAFGLVTTLPHSAAHAAVYTFSRTMGDFVPALLGGLVRLGGIPEVLLVDNDPSIIASGKGPRARLHSEVAALAGHLGLRISVLKPGKPESKGQVERTLGYLESSFLPLRTFQSLQDLQEQHDAWAQAVAYARHHRRVGGRVGEALDVERSYLRALPKQLPDVTRKVETRVTRDGFVRLADVDYSVPPGLAGRRIQARISLTDVTLYLEGRELAQHPRSYVPADVVMAPEHARALKRARQARSRLQRGDVELERIDLSVYDRLAEAVL